MLLGEVRCQQDQRSRGWEASSSYAGRDANARSVSTNHIRVLAEMRTELGGSVLYCIQLWFTERQFHGREISIEGLKK